MPVGRRRLLLLLLLHLNISWNEWLVPVGTGTLDRFNRIEKYACDVSLWSGTPIAPSPTPPSPNTYRRMDPIALSKPSSSGRLAHESRCRCALTLSGRTVRNHRYVYKLTQYMRAATAVWPVRLLIDDRSWWDDPHTQIPMHWAWMAKRAGAVLFRSRQQSQQCSKTMVRQLHREPTKINIYHYKVAQASDEVGHGCRGYLWGYCLWHSHSSPSS